MQKHGRRCGRRDRVFLRPLCRLLSGPTLAFPGSSFPASFLRTAVDPDTVSGFRLVVMKSPYRKAVENDSRQLGEQGVELRGIIDCGGKLIDAPFGCKFGDKDVVLRTSFGLAFGLTDCFAFG